MLAFSFGGLEGLVVGRCVRWTMLVSGRCFWRNGEEMGSLEAVLGGDESK